MPLGETPKPPRNVTGLNTPKIDETRSVDLVRAEMKLYQQIFMTLLEEPYFASISAEFPSSLARLLSQAMKDNATQEQFEAEWKKQKKRPIDVMEDGKIIKSSYFVTHLAGYLENRKFKRKNVLWQVQGCDIKDMISNNPRVKACDVVMKVPEEVSLYEVLQSLEITATPNSKL